MYMLLAKIYNRHNLKKWTSLSTVFYVQCYIEGYYTGWRKRTFVSGD